MAPLCCLDPTLWEQTHHNPIARGEDLHPDHLLTAVADNGSWAQVERVIGQFQEYAQPVQA
ncbi:DUF3417 domain-containing protein [Thermosynechococcus sp.]|uniref:DUF3417 domain-containing protein n=1 Tax=Thermosynechococcus sp. TaxID=2814275 RepID=UPI0037DDDEB0